jgi:hypothetical protein
LPVKNNLDEMNFAELSKEDLEILKEAEEKMNRKRNENKVYLLALN